MRECISAQRRADELGVIGLPLMSLGEVEALAGHVQKTAGREYEPMEALHEQTPSREHGSL